MPKAAMLPCNDAHTARGTLRRQRRQAAGEIARSLSAIQPDHAERGGARPQHSQAAPSEADYSTWARAGLGGCHETSFVMVWK